MNAKEFAKKYVDGLVGDQRVVTMSRQFFIQAIRAAYEAGKKNAKTPTLYVVGYSEDEVYRVIGRAGQKIEKFVALDGRSYAGMVKRVENYDVSNPGHAEFAETIKQFEKLP